MKRLKIAQIGVEHDHAADIMLTIRNLDMFEVVGYSRVDDLDIQFTPKKEIYKDVPEYTVEELLNIEGLEAVTIETCEKNLIKYALMALEKGLYVHIDKPGNESLEDFEKLINLVKQKNLTLHFGYMYRYNPAILKVRELAASGELGEIYSIETHMPTMYTDEKRKWLCSLKGGMMFFLGCHMLDVILQFIGKPQNVLPLSRSSYKNKIDSKDLGFAVLEYKNKNAFVEVSAVEAKAPMARKIKIVAEKDTIEINPVEHFTGKGIYEIESAYTRASTGETIYMPKTTRYGEMMKNFYDISMGNKQNEISLDYELELFKTILEASGLK